MKNWTKALLVITLLCLCSFPVPSQARSVAIPSVLIHVNLQPDGHAMVEETRTIQFDGKFTMGFYTLPKNTYGHISNFTVSDELGYYEFDDAFSEQVGTYTIRENHKEYTIEYFFEANNTTKTFTYTYLIENAIALYEDLGEFYWQLQGDGWDFAIEQFEAVVTWDSSVPIEEYYVWAYGPLWGEVAKVNEQSIYLHVEALPRNTYVEVKLLLPASYYTFPANHTGSLLEKTLEEEIQKAEQANIERERAQQMIASQESQRKQRSSTGLIIQILLFLIALGLAIYYFYLYFKYGKEHPVKQQHIYYREPPDDLKPAIAGKLFHMNTWNDKFLQATLLDLIHRKHLSYEKIGNTIFNRDKRLTLLKNDTDTLAPYEDILLNKIFFTKGEVVELRDLSRRMKSAPRHYHKLFESLKKSLDDETRKLNYFDEVSLKKSNFALGLGSFLTILAPIGLSFLSVHFMGQAVGGFYIFVPVGILYWAGSKALQRRTPEGAEEFNKWRAFRNFMKDYSNLKEYCPNSLIIWEKYLIFATVFGIASVVLRALQVAMPNISDRRQGTFLGPSIIAAGMTPNFRDLQSTLGDITSISSTVHRVASSSSSSGTGGGGGFSSGGGGGGGGSGGGFR